MYAQVHVLKERGVLCLRFGRFDVGSCLAKEMIWNESDGIWYSDDMCGTLNFVPKRSVSDSLWICSDAGIGRYNRTDIGR